jgi:hypothetical protein
LADLRARLGTVLQNNGSPSEDLAVIDRRPNRYQSTFPSEIVTCRIGENGTLRLFCKYGGSDFDGAFGHRGGVSYEAAVYSRVLAPLRISAPRFYGAYVDRRSGQTWLMIEYLKGASRDISKTNEAVIHAARWIGRFHAINEDRVSWNQLRFLRRYDADYYRGWARRARELFRDYREELPWLPSTCATFERLVPGLLNERKTVIHGEYYPTNVIFQDGISRPADWQSAAVAVGEIDIAALTQNWPSYMVSRLVREYKKARWPRGEPDEFDEVFRIARVYMTLRWLGDPSLASPFVRRKIFSKRSGKLSLRSRNLVRKYRRFIENLNSEREWMDMA